MAGSSGFRVRAAVEGDFEAVAEILEADELDDAGRVTLGAEFLRNEWNEVGFDLGMDAWVAADTEGAVVGYGQAGLTQPAEVESWGIVSVTGESDAEGWISFLGVLSAFRGRGIGGALLRRLFMKLADRGVERVIVNVDAANPNQATGVYERAGMNVVKRWDLWERTLTRVDVPPT